MSYNSRLVLDLSFEVHTLELNADGFQTIRCPNCSASELKIEEPR